MGQVDMGVDRARLDGLPQPVVAVLTELVDAAQEAFAADLVSVVLFGSAAEGKLTPTSDVNVILVLKAFTAKAADRMADTLLMAEAAVKLRAMFLLEGEIPLAAELFAQKFGDIRRRRRVLLGEDVFAAMTIPRAARIFRLRQVLLNLTLRLREAYASRAQRLEQIPPLLAAMTGPVRVACVTLMELDGFPSDDANAALYAMASSFGQPSRALVDQLLAARDGQLPAAGADGVLLGLIDLLTRMTQRARHLA